MPTSGTDRTSGASGGRSAGRSGGLSRHAWICRRDGGHHGDDPGLRLGATRGVGHRLGARFVGDGHGDRDAGSGRGPRPAGVPGSIDTAASGGQERIIGCVCTCLVLVLWHREVYEPAWCDGRVAPQRPPASQVRAVMTSAGGAMGSSRSPWRVTSSAAVPLIVARSRCPRGAVVPVAGDRPGRARAMPQEPE